MSLKKEKKTQLSYSVVKAKYFKALRDDKSIESTENEKQTGRSKCCGHKMAPVEAAKVKKIIGLQLIYIKLNNI